MDTIEDLVKVWKKLLPLVHNRSPSLIRGRFLLIGAGGVGTWVATLLTMSADISNYELLVIDDDVLEMVNANRLPYPLWWFNSSMAKVEALKTFLEMMRPGARIITYRMRLDDDTEDVVKSLMGKVDVVIDAVDSQKTIQRIWRLAKEAGKPVISAHYDGWHGSIMWIPPGSPPPAIWGEDAEGYTAPSLVVTPAILASFIVTLIFSRVNLPSDQIIHYAW